MRKILAPALAVLAVLITVACASQPNEAAISARTEALIAEMFAKGTPAVVARMKLDDEQMACNQYRSKPPKEVGEALEKTQLETIRFPADGKYMGDWKRGEKIAQSGQGFQFSDRPGAPAGGNCYACHELSPREQSFGTVGPSLRAFGKHRGTDESVQKYVYGKIYNSQAYSACSSMPRFGRNGVLDEQQIKDLVALVLDPESPVNK